MSEQKYTGDIIITKLLGLGGSALQYAMFSSDKDEKDLVINEFVEFFESIPEIVDKHPNFTNKKFAVDLMKTGVAFGRLTPMGRICLTAGRVLSRIGKKNPDIIEPAMNYLKETIRGGEAWEYNEAPAAQIVRNDALEITLSAIIGMPDAANAELVHVVTEAAVLPYCMDIRMMKTMVLYREETVNPMPADKIAEISSNQARETLAMMIDINPSLANDAFEALKTAENTVKKFAFEEVFFEGHSTGGVRPVAFAAVEQTRQTIFKAVKKAPVPARRTSNDDIKNSFLNILVL